MDHETQTVARAIRLFAEDIVKFARHLESGASNHRCHTDFAKLEQRINCMASAIAEFAARQNAFNDRLDVAVDGLVTDVKTLNDLIEKLQNNPGPISPEDQALLDQLEARTDALTAKIEALDAQTPPPIPVA